MTHKLDGQIALVTGASRGIGEAVADRLGRAGAYIIGTATTGRGAKKIEAGLKSAGIEGRGLVLNVSDPQSVAHLSETLAEDDVRPSILVNNAGITRDNLMMRMKADEWDDVINTNLGSVYRLTRVCLRAMLKARYGRIINMASVVALSGNPGQANYAATKAGMIGFARALAREVGGRGITVNCIAPGFIKTDMTDALSAEQHERLLEQIPLGRLGLADEVAHVALFLASNAASYITGEVIHVNGGMYMA